MACLRTSKDHRMRGGPAHAYVLTYVHVLTMPTEGASVGGLVITCVTIQPQSSVTPSDWDADAFQARVSGCIPDR